MSPSNMLKNNKSVITLLLFFRIDPLELDRKD